MELSGASLSGMGSAAGADGPAGFKLKNVGQEKVKVPLGTFLCDHWIFDNGKRQFDFWLATDASIPFIRAVKFTTEEGVAVATATGTDAAGTILVPGPRRRTRSKSTGPRFQGIGMGGTGNSSCPCRSAAR